MGIAAHLVQGVRISLSDPVRGVPAQITRPDIDDCTTNIDTHHVKSSAEYVMKHKGDLTVMDFVCVAFPGLLISLSCPDALGRRDAISSTLMVSLRDHAIFHPDNTGR